MTPRDVTTSYTLYLAAAGIYVLAFVIAVVAFVQRKEDLSRVSSGVLVAGLLLHLHTLGGHFRTHGLTTFLETPFHISSAYVFVSLLGGYLISLRYGFRSSLCVLFAMPLVIALGSLTIDPSFSPFAARLKGTYVQIHLICLVLAYGAFTVASGLGLMLVARVRSLEQKSRGLLAEVLPPLRQLDRATMVGVEAGFVLLSASILAAAYHASTVGWVAHGKPGKAILAMLVWVFYASLVTGRHWGRWRGGRIGWLAFFGVLFAFGSFVGIQLVGGSL